MTAIWPAGPPNVCNEMANQVRTAVRKGITGSAAARRLPDRACALAVLAMTSRLGSGDLVGAIVNGLRQMSDAAGHPSRRPH